MHVPVCAYETETFQILMYEETEEINFPNASGKIMTKKYRLWYVPALVAPTHGKNGASNTDVVNNWIIVIVIG